MISDHKRDYEDNDNNNEKFQGFAIFRCKGLELKQFFPGRFIAESVHTEHGIFVFGNETFGEDDIIDLADGDWSGYDE